VEALGYAFGVVAFPAASVGAPHIRDRAYWVAHSLPTGWPEGWPEPGHRSITGSGEHGGVVYPVSAGLEGYAGHGDNRDEPGRLDAQSAGSTAAASGACGLADADSARSQPRHEAPAPNGHGRTAITNGGGDAASPLHGFWSDADWLLCRDGKWRPVEPGTFPLAHGVSNRVGKLRGYGNAIVPQQAAEFVSAFMDYQRAVA
jgi:DNA (cytosine-5)-methyltransferase 1